MVLGGRRAPRRPGPPLRAAAAILPLEMREASRSWSTSDVMCASCRSTTPRAVPVLASPAPCVPRMSTALRSGASGLRSSWPSRARNSSLRRVSSSRACRARFRARDVPEDGGCPDQPPAGVPHRRDGHRHGQLGGRPWSAAPTRRARSRPPSRSRVATRSSSSILPGGRDQRDGLPDGLLRPHSRTCRVAAAFQVGDRRRRGSSPRSRPARTPRSRPGALRCSSARLSCVTSDERHDQPVDDVVQAAVGQDAHQVGVARRRRGSPGARGRPSVRSTSLRSVTRSPSNREGDVRDGPAHVRLDEAEDVRGRLREPLDAEARCPGRGWGSACSGAGSAGRCWRSPAPRPSCSARR